MFSIVVDHTLNQCQKLFKKKRLKNDPIEIGHIETNVKL